MGVSTAGTRPAPGPASRLQAGNIPAMRRDELAFYGRLKREYGDVVGDAGHVGDALATLLKTLDSLVLFVVFMVGGVLADRVESLPIGVMRRFREARDELDRIIQRMIDERRREGAGGSDLLSSLLALREAGAGM